MSSSQYLYKQACVACTSSDGFAIYDDGHGYCFACNHHEFRVEDAEGSHQQQQQTKPKPKANLFVNGQYIDLPSRRLFEKTLRKFRYSIADNKHYAPYFDKDGNQVAQKVRTPEKDFYVTGDMNKALLFGQQLWGPGQRLIICEGELDCMSYAQVTGLSWQVVSIPSGAQGAAKAIRKQITFVESFDEVVFMFDMDEPGQKAARECAAILKPGLAKLAKLPLKDANAMLMANREADLKNAVYSAIPYRPDGIVTGADVDLDEIIKGIPKGLTLPYPELNSAIRGLRKRELVLLCAGSGIGKSTFAREIGYHLLTEHKQRVGWVMLEESLGKTVAGVVAIDHNVPLSDLIENGTDALEYEYWSRTYKEHIVRCEFNTEWGCQDIDELISKLRYLAVGAECDWIIFDHLHLAISGLKDHDERRAIDSLMTNLRLFVQQTGVGLLTVAHLRRNTAKESFNEGGMVSLTDLRGSSALEQLSDIVIASERNQQEEERVKSNVTQLRLLKNRPFGVVGPVGKLRYDDPTGRLLPYDEKFDPGVVRDLRDDVPF